MNSCINCNNPLEDESLFCNKCGAKQKDDRQFNDNHVDSVDNSVIKNKRKLSKKFYLSLRLSVYCLLCQLLSI